MTVDPIVFVGSYADPANAPARPAAGIRTYRLDPDSGALSLIDHTTPEMEAGFLCVSADRRFLYGVDERKNDGRGPIGPPASAKAFAIANDGRLVFLNSQPAYGPLPCYISVDPTGGWVVTASHGSSEHVERVIRTEQGFEIEHLYDDSTVALYPVDSSGSLDPACDVQVFEGHGADPAIPGEVGADQVGGHPQASPHAHSAKFDPAGRFIVVCEKGADRIYSYSIDAQERRFREPIVFTTPAGSGPRHPAFHSTLPLVFITNEKASTVSSYSYDPEGTLTHIQTTRTTSPEYDGGNAPAEVKVHPAGRCVFLNNRGEDTVVAFRLDEPTGELSRAGAFRLATPIHPSVGARSFAFDSTGRFMFVADRPADAVLTLAVDADTGQLTLAHTTHVPQPGFVTLASLQ